MTFINPLIPSPALASRPKRWLRADLLVLAASGLRRGWLAYIRYKRLAKLTDESLAARGLNRRDIGRHAFFSDRNWDGRN